MTKLVCFLSFLLLVGEAQAGVIFTFTQSGGNVTMTGSGTLDTSKLVSRTVGPNFGGFGVYDAASLGLVGADVMGAGNGTFDREYSFNAGTVLTAWNNLWNTDVTWTTSGPFFATGFVQAGTVIPGFQLNSANLAGNLWNAGGISWTRNGATFASLGMSVGDFTITDAVTNEFITMRFAGGLAAVPEPSSFALIGAIGAFGVWKRRRSQKVA